MLKDAAGMRSTSPSLMVRAVVSGAQANRLPLVDASKMPAQPIDPQLPKLLLVKMRERIVLIGNKNMEIFVVNHANVQVTTLLVAFTQKVAQHIVRITLALVTHLMQPVMRLYRPSHLQVGC